MGEKGISPFVSIILIFFQTLYDTLAICVKFVRETFFIPMFCNTLVHMVYCSFVLSREKSLVGSFFDTTDRKNSYENSSYVVGLYMQAGPTTVLGMRTILELVMESTGCLGAHIGLDAQVWGNRPDSPLCYCVHEHHAQLVSGLSDDSVVDPSIMVYPLQQQCFWKYLPTQMQVSGPIFFNPCAVIIFPMTIGTFFSFTVFSVHFRKLYVTNSGYQRMYDYVDLIMKGGILLVGALSCVYCIWRQFEISMSSTTIILSLFLLFCEDRFQSYKAAEDPTAHLNHFTVQSVVRIYESVYLWVMVAGDLVTVFMITNMYSQSRYVFNFPNDPSPT